MGGDEAARKVSAALFAAYFSENFDITDEATMKRLWADAGLDEAGFAHVQDEDLLQAVLEEHRSALEHGVTGVPAIMLEGNDVPITGAHPRTLYRRWIDRTLEERGQN